MEYLTVSGESQDTEGGDPACWTHLVCPERGAVETKGHRPGCRYELPNASDADQVPEA